jgi:hypothetical protein
MKYKVTLPVTQGMPKLSLWGLGTFVAGVARELELSEEQVKSLRVRRFAVVKASDAKKLKQQEKADEPASKES